MSHTSSLQEVLTKDYDLQLNFALESPIGSGAATTAAATTAPYPYPTSLTEALRDAQRRAKYLLVYLHAPEHPDTEEFLRVVLPELVNPQAATATTAPKDTNTFSESSASTGVSAAAAAASSGSSSRSSVTETPQQRLIRAREIIANQCVWFPVDVRSSEGHTLCHELNVQAFPYIALFVKKHILVDIQGGTQLGLLPKKLPLPAVGGATAAAGGAAAGTGGVTGVAPPSQPPLSGLTASIFVEEIITAVEKGYPLLAKELSFILDRQQRDMERKAHEEELLEATRQDELRAAAREAAKIAKAKEAEEERLRIQKERQEKEEEEARKRQEAQEAERKEMEIQERKACALSLVPASVPADGANTTTIRLMSLNGTPYDHTFLVATTSLHVLYAVAASRPEYDGRAFELVTGRPTAVVIPDSDSTMMSEVALLKGRALVMMKPT